MCTTCGCSDDARATITNLDTGETSAVDGHVHHHHDHDHAHAHSHDHVHDHDHDHGHDHHHPHSHDHDGHAHRHSHAHDGHTEHRHGVVTLERQILAKNDQLAARNRGWFEGRATLALNLVSSPGAGKTTLLERTLADLGDSLPFAVIEGDQATANDARRLRETGVPVVQINTGTGCHLEADMVARGVRELRPPLASVLFIENVGNLVCPALFDLGEHAKIAILSVTEGEDKPIKYPHMFRASKLMILSKTDLLPYVSFDVDRCKAHAREVNPDIEIIEVSATTGEGMDHWYAWIRREAALLGHGAAAGPLTAESIGPGTGPRP